MVCTAARKIQRGHCYVILALWLDTGKGLWTQTHSGPTITRITVGIVLPYRINILAGIMHLTTRTQHYSRVKMYPLRPSHRTELSSRNRTYHSSTLHKHMTPTNNHHPKRCRFRAALSYLTHSLPDYPVLSIFFLVGLHPFSHEDDTVVPVLVSGCFPLCLRAAATFVGSFCSHVSLRHRLFLPHRRYPCSTPGPRRGRKIPITPSEIEPATFLAVSVPTIKSRVRIKGYVNCVWRQHESRT
jgi:hypothetical protein